MFLPENLHERRFHEWNYLVRGLVEVWELARAYGLERQLEAALACDPGGLVERVARIGNGFYALAEVLSVERAMREASMPLFTPEHVELAFRRLPLTSTTDPGFLAGDA